MKYKGWFDGSAKPNPGIMKIGGYIEDENGKIIYKFSTELGDGTNNRAEYLALYSLCTILEQYQIEEIDIQGDSQLVVNQVNGEWKCKDPQLRAFKDGILYLLQGLKWTLTHVYRENNKEADSLTR
jgi:ribonuclease HI